MKRRKRHEITHTRVRPEKQALDSPPDAWEETVMQDELEGSGATGGRLTGEGTPGAMSEDLTSGRAGGGHYGGPTGGDFRSGGAGSLEPSQQDTPMHGISVGVGMSEDAGTGLVRKVAAENNAEEINEAARHPAVSPQMNVNQPAQSPTTPIAQEQGRISDEGTNPDAPPGSILGGTVSGRRPMREGGSWGRDPQSPAHVPPYGPLNATPLGTSEGVYATTTGDVSEGEAGDRVTDSAGENELGSTLGGGPGSSTGERRALNPEDLRKPMKNEFKR